MEAFDLKFTWIGFPLWRETSSCLATPPSAKRIGGELASLCF